MMAPQHKNSSHYIIDLRFYLQSLLVLYVETTCALFFACFLYSIVAQEVQRKIRRCSIYSYRESKRDSSYCSLLTSDGWLLITVTATKYFVCLIAVLYLIFSLSSKMRTDMNCLRSSAYLLFSIALITFVSCKQSDKSTTTGTSTDTLN